MTCGPGYEALRRGRYSQPASRYFLTLTTEERRNGLNSAPLATVIKREIIALESDGSWRVHAAVIMPDHLHLLITLGPRLSLGQSVGRLKTKTRGFLAEAGLGWQGNYYDRHLRPDDQPEEVIRYIFLNPYRANLLTTTKTYDWTWIGSEEQRWLMPQTGDRRPFPEWLQ